MMVWVGGLESLNSGTKVIIYIYIYIHIYHILIFIYIYMYLDSQKPIICWSSWEKAVMINFCW
jgi:hypothetical protein